MVCRKDVVGDGAVADLKAALSGGDMPVEDRKFPESGHLAHLDEREEYVTVRQQPQGRWSKSYEQG